MTIQEKVKQLLIVRAKVNAITDSLAPLKEERDAIQADIIKHMSRQGFNSVKTENATVSKAKRKRLVIQDERELISDLKKQGLNDYVREQIDKNLFAGFATQVIKSGNIPAGTTIEETEFISIRSNKKKDDGK